MGSCQSSNVLRVPHEKRFRRAIKLYEVAEVESLVNVINRNRCFESGESPLTLAAQEGHEAVVEALVRGGADVNRLDRNGRGPLHIAVQINDLETVEVLLKGSADPNRLDRNNQTPVHVACERGYRGILERLLQAGASPNARKDDDALPSPPSPPPPLTLASSRGHSECVQLLLKHGADPNTRDPSGESPLRMAVSNGDAISTKALLEHGLLQQEKDANTTTTVDDLGALAALSGRPEVLEALIAAGYDVTCSPSDVNEIPPALITATAVQSVDCVALLLRCGCNANARDKVGQTALQIAVMSVVDVQKQPYYLRYFSNVYRQYSKYDVHEPSVENCIKCATHLIQSGSDVSLIWNKFIHVFPGGDSISFEQMVLCEVLIQAYGFVDLSNRKLRYFVKNLLDLRERGLVRLLYSAGVEPDWVDQSVLAMSWDDSDKAMFRYIKRMCANPRTLKDICRQRLRRHLSWNVLYLASRLPLISDQLRDYVCIIDTDCYSDVDMTSQE
jgi:ankyrin repeat protein